jgi:hypothetical protein
MAFNKENYLIEMKSMVDKALERLRTEHPKFEIYTVSIWTDPNAAASSINFESKANSGKVVERSNKFDKEQYEELIAEGDLETAELFQRETWMIRNCNPADFELKDFEEILHPDSPINWEYEKGGRCWPRLKPALTEIGKYTFKKCKICYWMMILSWPSTVKRIGMTKPGS